MSSSTIKLVGCNVLIIKKAKSIARELNDAILNAKKNLL